MRRSVIDIGTNTVLLLVADVEAGGRIIPVHNGHEIARLGKGVDEHRVIPPEAMERVAAVLQKYVAVSKELNAGEVIACGTSALRDATNRDEVLRFVKSRFGFDVRILTGKEEAEMTYLGAISEFSDSPDGSYAVLDIGGGSTEITIGRGIQILNSASLELGCVRLTERFLKLSPPTSLAMSDTLRTIRTEIRSLAELRSTARFIGVAGTVTTLAAIDLGLEHYDSTRVSGHDLSLETIQGIFNRLRIKSVEEMKSFPQIHPGRADILLAGIVILQEVMKQLNVQVITASDRGLRYGVALKAVSGGW